MELNQNNFRRAVEVCLQFKFVQAQN